MGTQARGGKLSWPAPAFFSSRPLMCCAMTYCAGIVFLRRIAFSSWLLIPIGLGVLLSFLLCEKRRASFALAAACFLALGAVRGSMEWTAPPMPSFGNWVVEGTVHGFVKQDEAGARFYLDNARVTSEEGESIPIDSRVYVNCQTAYMRGELLHGQRVRVEGTSSAPKRQRNPGGFDQQSWLAENGAHATLYSRRAPALIDPGGFSVMRAAIQTSRYLCDALDSIFGKASPVIRSMLIGDQSEVSDEWYDWFRISGVAHILAVSGLNVGMWYMLIDKPLRRLPVSQGVRFLLLAVFLCMYSMITGLSASVLRAALMLLVLQGGKVAKRKPDPLTSLSIAALVILLFRPIDLLRPGFQLSFCAVLGIFLLNPQVSRAVRFKPHWLSETICVSISAQIGALPALAYWFHTMSLLSIPANAVAVPISSFLIPISILALLLHAVAAPLAWLFVESGKGIVAVILLVCKWTSRVSGAVLTVAPFALWTIAAYALCAILLCSATVWDAKRRTCAALIAMGIAAGIGISQHRGDARYVQLDVGEALSGVLHVGNQTFVYDCGGKSSDLTEYLITVGKDVDALFLSHPRMDHIGGLGELLSSSVQTKTIYVPAQAEAFGGAAEYPELLLAARGQGIEIIELSKGDVLNLGGLTATVLGPEAEATRGNNANNRSLVLLIDINGKSLLLCGDADGAFEPVGVSCDVLQVANHGGKNAAGEDFISGAEPEIALISTGKNAYGHPDPMTLSRIGETGASIYRTDESGAITVYFGPESIDVEVFCR